MKFEKIRKHVGWIENQYNGLKLKNMKTEKIRKHERWMENQYNGLKLKNMKLKRWESIKDDLKTNIKVWNVRLYLCSRKNCTAVFGSIM